MTEQRSDVFSSSHVMVICDVCQWKFVTPVLSTCAPRCPLCHSYKFYNYLKIKSDAKKDKFKNIFEEDALAWLAG